jgi:hypothetical protein
MQNLSMKLFFSGQHIYGKLWQILYFWNMHPLTVSGHRGGRHY